ncbi:hypothetical protein ACSU64_21000 [Bacillaceae bacterium C204]|uniref:hypothetical protein n=1 Tax=Neobacillus sp. 204 TaxID=3383351 RepID=UPI0039791F22
MKFETKYLIRWGIPGWVFIFWLFYAFIFLKDINILDVKSLELSKGLALLISLAALGVPVGYIFHQIYFGIIWVANVTNKSRNYDEIANKIGSNFPKHAEWGNDTNEDYYQFEYVWHMVLLNQNEETRKYLEGRYSHLLSTIHSLGSLFISSAFSFLTSIVLIWNLQNDLTSWIYVIIGLTTQFIVFTSAMFNYIYFSNNLNAFQIKIMKTYL